MALEAPKSASSAEPLKVWNCVNCRRRKVRCDRHHPCAPCIRNRTECIFPVSGRIPRRSRDANYPKSPGQKQTELVGRLRRLEAMVGGLSSQVENAVALNQGHHSVESSVSAMSEKSRETGWPDQLPLHGQPDSSNPPTHEWQAGSGIAEINSEFPQVSDDFGVLEVASNGDLVVGTRFWTVFCKEVEDIFEAVQGHTVMHFDDDSSTSMSGNPRHTGYYNFLLRSTSATHQNKDIHPLPSQMLFLWQIYVDNVDPFLKVLHVPTITKVIREIRGSYLSLSPSMQALLLAISLAAIISLEDKEVIANFNTDKDQLVARYRIGAEHALEQADFLNKPEITVLQALAIYISVLQHSGETTSAWVLAGVLVRVAVTMKFHQDTSRFADINTFETEMRRRLWWQICFVDSQSENLQVSEFKLSEGMFDTNTPANTNDANLDPEMAQPLVLTEGWTEMTVFLIRCEVWKLSRQLQSVRAVSLPQDVAEKFELFQKFQARIENTYLKHLDPNQSFHLFTATSVRLFLAKVDLILHMKQRTSRATQPADTQQSEKLFISSLSIIEYAYELQSEPRWSSWRWQIQGRQPLWHALRVVLRQLCIRGWEPVYERAWNLVQRSIDNISEALRSDPRYQELLALASAVERRADEHQRQTSRRSMSGHDDITSATASYFPAPSSQVTSKISHEPFLSMTDVPHNHAFSDGPGPEMDWQAWDEIAGDLEFWDVGGL